MTNEFRYSIIIMLFAALFSAHSLFASSEPNERDIQSDKEKMQKLREVYKEVQQAEMELYRLSKEAEANEPLLRPTIEALKAIRDFYDHDANMTKNSRRFQQYLDSSEDRKYAYRMYDECKGVFSHNKFFDLLKDPNQERLVKKPLTQIYRKALPKDPNMGFDTNDPNDENFWQSVKKVLFKQMPEEYLQQMRDYYVKDKGVPEWLPDYAGNMAFADQLINTYESGIFLLTPVYVRDAEKKLDGLYVKMSRIYPAWYRIRHLLADENNPDRQEVILEIQEHMQIWPSVYRQ